MPSDKGELFRQRILPKSPIRIIMLDKGKRETKIENRTTASKIAIQASAKERRGHKQAQESKQGRIEELRQQARRNPSKREHWGKVFHACRFDAR